MTEKVDSTLERLAAYGIKRTETFCRKVKGVSFSKATGGYKCPTPGGYERQQPWGVALPTPSAGVTPWGAER